MNIEEKAFKAQEFLNTLKEQVFVNEKFTKIFTAEGNLRDDTQKIISMVGTTLKIYTDAKEKAEMLPMDPYSKGEYMNAILGLETTLSKYEKFCIGTLLPTLKQKLIELPDKIDKGHMELDQSVYIRSIVETPPPRFEIKPDVIIPINSFDDKRVNAFKEKINRALEWIEIPLKIGEGAEQFLSDHGKMIIFAVSAVFGALKLLVLP